MMKTLSFQFKELRQVFALFVAGIEKLLLAHLMQHIDHFYTIFRLASWVYAA